MKTRISAIVLAAVLLIMSVSSALPALAVGMFATKEVAPLPKFNTPEGYNDNDYQKLVSFFEIEDENGVKNGEKLSEIYDPEDPTTWTDFSFFDVFWRGGSVYRIRLGYNKELFGRLDVSDFTSLDYLFCGENVINELDVSGCTALVELYCYENALTELDVSSCAALEHLDCSENELTELDVSGCTALVELDCYYNALTELDISSCSSLNNLCCSNNALTELDISSCFGLLDLDCHDNELTELDVSRCTELSSIDCANNALSRLDICNCALLRFLDCTGNSLTQLDLSENPYIPFDYLKAKGDGTISIRTSSGDYGYYSSAKAEPKDGRAFLGWYSLSGELISVQLSITSDATEVTRLVAKFEHIDIVPGDLTGDGAVSANDALLALRASMNLLTLTEDQLAAVDVNHNGYLDATDALMILRAAMGLITL